MNATTGPAIEASAVADGAMAIRLAHERMQLG